MAESEPDISTRMAALESSQLKIVKDFKEVQTAVTLLPSMQAMLSTLTKQLQKRGALAISSDAVEEDKESEEDNKMHAWQATTTILEKQLEEKNDTLRGLEELVKTLQADQTNLQIQISDLEKERDTYKHKAEVAEQELGGYREEEPGETILEFPSNETILHNLLIAQIEFYFSNHHLKRDKPLMERLCSKPDVGYIPFDEVCQFPKVRTLGQAPETIKKAVLASKYLTLKGGEGENLSKAIVGRHQFQPPKAQEFPFRRTVFVYGIPPEKKENWITTQFDCFGVISKVKFDSGEHSLPRKVGARLLSKEPSRVVQLKVRDADHTEYKFRNCNAVNGMSNYTCHDCQKMKNYRDGFYSSDRHGHFQQYPTVLCVQCAAKRAENNLRFFEKSQSSGSHYSDPTSLKRLFGIDQGGSENLTKFRTCLVVFESQRQASKCVYVRSRLGIEGCFATHFHNYTRHKREISQGIDTTGDDEPPMGLHRLQAAPQRSVPVMRGARVEPRPYKRDYGARESFGTAGLTRPGMNRHKSAPVW